MNPARPLTIDVVIAAHGRYPLTRKCLSHLARQTMDHRVILVDNNSPDETVQCTRTDFPNVQVIALPQNLPFGKATNLGATSGSGDIIVILNNDVECQPDFLEHLTEPFLASPTVGSAAGLIVRPDGMVDSFGLTADATLACFPRHQGLPPSTVLRSGLVAFAPAGAAAAYRRSAWDDLGGLDERFPAYMEDFELGLRLQAAGWSCAFVDSAIAVHVGSATFGRNSTRQRWSGGFGRGYVLRRYGLTKGRLALRSVGTEAIVMVADAVLSRDLAAARGRWAGWSAAAGLSGRQMPPPQVVDHSVGFLQSIDFRLRGRSA